jgi:prepilin-type N-terminal cleavage/methylation domain-containing protein
MKNKAFTLVELAIVIVVLGIVASAIVGGRSIIRSANVNSTINEVQKMKTAVRAFELEFGETPGLLRDAYDYFGDDCGADQIWPYHGCNGDYTDRCVDIETGHPCRIGGTTMGDIRRLPMHLVLSGIHPELAYVSNTNTNDDCSTYLNKVPIGSEYWLSTITPGALNMYFFNRINITRTDQRCNHGFATSTSPQIVKTIDEKLDDGNGRGGSLKAIFNPGDDSMSGVDCLDENGVYNVSNDGEDCGFMVEIK